MIKKVIRFELPETNSSSSHSVIISELKNSKNNLEINEGIIYIPDPSEYDFGRTGFQAFNDSLSKIVFTIAVYNSTHELGEVLKFLNNLKYIICSYTGASDVVFESINKFNAVSKTFSDTNDYGTCCDNDEYLNETIWEICEIAFGRVDHESLDLSEEILENKDSLKNFIFSENSWLFLGDDGINMEIQISEILRKYYCLEQEDDNYASIDFSKYGIGKVDIELPNLFLGGDFVENLLYKKENFLANISFDNVDKTLKLENSFRYSPGYPDKNRLVVYSVPVGDQKGLRNVNTVVSHEGELYIYMINSIFYDSASEYFIPFLHELTFEELGEGFLYIIKKYNLIEEKDWIRFKVEINTKEFGKL